MDQFVDDICELIRKSPADFELCNVENEFIFTVRVVDILWYKGNFCHLKEGVIRHRQTGELFEFKYIPDGLLVDPEKLIRLQLEN